MSMQVVSRREGPLQWVGIARPEKRNALNRHVLAELLDAVGEGERDPEVRAIIIYGEGKVFSAGVDFGTLHEDMSAENPTPFRTVVGDLQAQLTRFETVEKPLIGALHRYVPGLGLELALALDLRVASADCELGLPETRLGLIPDVGGTTRLVRTVGYAKAKELIMTARMIGADEAMRIGLVNEVVPVGQHLEAAARLGHEIAANAPLAVGLAKRVIALGANLDRQSFLEVELLAQSVLRQTDDAREGVRALRERRPPVFRGR